MTNNLLEVLLLSELVQQAEGFILSGQRGRTEGRTHGVKSIRCCQTAGC